LSQGVCLYLTDGYSDFPEQPPELAVLWVITPGGLDLAEFLFGEAVRLLSNFASALFDRAWINRLYSSYSSHSRIDFCPMNWTAEAEAKLKEIPFFVRPAARKKIEKLAEAIGVVEITEDIYIEAKKKFG
jgi:hypothetical protein